MDIKVSKKVVDRQDPTWVTVIEVKHDDNQYRIVSSYGDEIFKNGERVFYSEKTDEINEYLKAELGKTVADLMGYDERCEECNVTVPENARGEITICNECYGEMMDDMEYNLG